MQDRNGRFWEEQRYKIADGLTEIEACFHLKVQLIFGQTKSIDIIGQTFSDLNVLTYFGQQIWTCE